jgi:hypothetical protein
MTAATSEGENKLSSQLRKEVCPEALTRRLTQERTQPGSR